MLAAAFLLAMGDHIIGWEDKPEMLPLGKEAS